MYCAKEILVNNQFEEKVLYISAFGEVEKVDKDSRECERQHSLLSTNYRTKESKRLLTGNELVNDDELSCAVLRHGIS